MPGGIARISFSINNDSMTDAKKVDLRLEGFTGETSGAKLDASTFTIRPPQKSIAPADFEKFVLQGDVPQNTVPDMYRGVIIVASDDELNIPVMLVITPL